MVRTHRGALPARRHVGVPRGRDPVAARALREHGAHVLRERARRALWHGRRVHRPGARRAPGCATRRAAVRAHGRRPGWRRSGDRTARRASMRVARGRRPRALQPFLSGTAMNASNVAIVGATGAVGRTLLSILEERRFPLDRLTLLATSRSAGETRAFGGRHIPVQEVSPALLEGHDLVFFSAGTEAAKRWVPVAVER